MKDTSRTVIGTKKKGGVRLIIKRGQCIQVEGITAGKGLESPGCNVVPSRIKRKAWERAQTFPAGSF